MPIEEIARRGIGHTPVRAAETGGARASRNRQTFLRGRAASPRGRARTDVELWSGFKPGSSGVTRKEVLRLIPGLENAEVVRYGVMHRNTYLERAQTPNP